MSRRPDGNSQGRGARPKPPRQLARPADTADAPSTGGRLVLSRQDWAALAIVGAILLIAPIWCAGFSTPSQPVVFSPVALVAEGMLALTMEIWAGPVVLFLAVAAFCVLALREWKRPVAIGAVPGLAAALGSMAVWAILSAAANHVLYLSLNALSYLFAALLIGGIVSRLGRSRHGIGALVVTIALAGSLIAGIGVREYLAELREGVIGHRTFSTFGPDFLAGYLLLTLPVTLAAFAAASGRSLRLALGVGLALQSGCLFLTGSRAGTAIAIAGLLIWVLIAALTGFDRTRRRWVAGGIAIFVVSSAVSATPTLARFERPPAGAGLSRASSTEARPPVEDTQSHSGEFRKRTWIGTVRMAVNNPLLGTGIGTFQSAYPRYADTAFTGHAHNSFLQWAAETGYPGALALLTAFAAASAFIANIVLLVARREKCASGGDVKPDGTALLEAPGLLLAGFIAALLASALHNLFDSDLYVVATLLTFSALFGLAVAQARALAPLTTQTPRPVGRELWTVGAVLCLFMLVRGTQVGVSRWERAQVGPAPTGAGETSSAAIEMAKSAATADWLDPEPWLALAQQQPDRQQREAALREAARVAPTGMNFYLLGRSYGEDAAMEVSPARRAELLKSSIDMLERARACDPHNLQALRVLAETQRQAGQIREAQLTYQTMAALETSPYGTVRAMPEMKEADFAYAHAGLADIASNADRPADAEREYARAGTILAEYWGTRNWLVNMARTPARRRGYALLYIHVLEARENSLKRLGRSAEIGTIDKQLMKVRLDAASDEKKPENSGG